MARIELSQVDNGTVVEAAIGDEIVVRLDEIPASGHRWAVEELPAYLDGPSEDAFTPSDSGVGAGGRRTLVFRVRALGEGRLTLVRRQEWEPEHPSGRFNITVNASDR